jgi:magnesium-transporting ATPase (P-type)
VTLDDLLLPAGALLGDRRNMAFAGTLVTRGRGRGVAVATGLGTEVGRLASALLGEEDAKPPLIQRMEKFTVGIAIAVLAAALMIFAAELGRGTPLFDIFFLAVALAVSAIPEGLPVAHRGVSRRHASHGPPSCHHPPHGRGGSVGILHLHRLR